MYIEFTYTLLIKDNDGTVKLQEPMGESITIEKDDVTEKGKMTISVPAGASDLEQAFANVDNANLLFIRTTESITFKKNSDTGEVQNIVADKRAESTKYGICIMTTSGITKLYFSNAGSNAAKVEIIFAS
jgi:hypothetical protein